jgi:hypothetical protein
MKQIEELVDIYTDYLIATKLSKVLDGIISHDKFTRMLKERAFNSRYLWKKVKVSKDSICSIFYITATAFL